MARGWPPTRSWKPSIFWGGQWGRGAAGRWPWLGAAALGEQAAGARPPLTAVTVTGVLHLTAAGSSCVRLRQAPGSPRGEEISFLDYVPALSQRHLSSRGPPPHFQLLACGRPSLQPNGSVWSDAKTPVALELKTKNKKP